MKRLKTSINFIILCSVVLILAEITVLTDAKKKLKSLERQRAQLVQEYQVKSHQADNIDAYKQQLEILEASFGTLIRALPDGVSHADVHIEMTQQALALGSEIIRFSFLGEKKKGFYAESRFAIRFSPDFDKLVLFLEGLYSLPRLTSIKTLSVNTYSNKLRVDAEIMVYRYLSEDEQ